MRRMRRSGTASRPACQPIGRYTIKNDNTTFASRPSSTSRKHIYICPAGPFLARKQEALRRDCLILYVARDCTRYSLKPRCTTANVALSVAICMRTQLERMNSRFQTDPTLIRQRRCASEHPFGTIKRIITGARFLTRGLNKKPAQKQRSAYLPTISFARLISSVPPPSAQDLLEPSKRGSG